MACVINGAKHYVSYCCIAGGALKACTVQGIDFRCGKYVPPYFLWIM